MPFLTTLFAILPKFTKWLSALTALIKSESDPEPAKPNSTPDDDVMSECKHERKQSDEKAAEVIGLPWRLKRAGSQDVSLSFLTIQMC